MLSLAIGSPRAKQRPQNSPVANLGPVHRPRAGLAIPWPRPFQVRPEQGGGGRKDKGQERSGEHILSSERRSPKVSLRPEIKSAGFHSSPKSTPTPQVSSAFPKPQKMEASGYGWHAEVASRILLLRAASCGQVESPAPRQGGRHPQHHCHPATLAELLRSCSEGIRGATVAFQLRAVTLQLSPERLHPSKLFRVRELAFLPCLQNKNDRSTC